MPLSMLMASLASSLGHTGNLDGLNLGDFMTDGDAAKHMVAGMWLWQHLQSYS